MQIRQGGCKRLQGAARYKAGMTRILIVAIVLMISGKAQATAPEFDMERFCVGFVKSHASGDMGELAKAVCMLSEESTKTIVDKAWDHAPAGSREACLKTAGDSYVGLAHCLGSVPGQ